MSKYASTAEAEKVAAAYESVKSKVAEGSHPTEALHQAVVEAGLGHDHADTIGHTLNQTIAASVQLDDRPHENFATADVEEVKRRLSDPSAEKPKAGTPPAKAHKARRRAPTSNDFTDHVAPKAAKSEKTASLASPAFAFDKRAFLDLGRRVRERLSEHAESCARVMEDKVAAFSGSYALASLPERQQALYAMMGENALAADMVASHAESAMGFDTNADMDKHAGLPAHCGQAALDGVMAVKAAVMYDEALDCLQKVAVVEDIQEVIEGLGDLAEKGDAGSQVGEQMSPEALLRQRGFKATNELYKALLFNPEISRYSPDQAVKAYNSVVQMNPDAVNNSFLLQSMMTDRLARGGIVDPMALANEQKMSLHGLERRKLTGEIAANAAKAKKDLADAGRREKGEKTMPRLLEGLDTAAETAKGALGRAVDVAKGFVPAKTDKSDKPGKPARPSAPSAVEGDSAMIKLMQARLAPHVARHEEFVKDIKAAEQAIAGHESGARPLSDDELRRKYDLVSKFAPVANALSSFTKDDIAAATRSRKAMNAAMGEGQAGLEKAKAIRDAAARRGDADMAKALTLLIRARTAHEGFDPDKE